jgi:Leucine-rich repeat (LRR) protein
MLSIVLLCQSVTSVEISCKYYGYDWNDWGERYTCGATLEDVTDSLKVSSVVGDHFLEKSNDDVKAVDFSGQKTYHLVQELLTFFPNMEELYVFRSDLKYLTRSDFEGYTKLTTMSLSRNHLSTLPYDTFEDLTNMEYFSLSFNQLTTIPNLKTMSKLKELYLFENSIESFSHEDVSGNLNLEVVWLYQNKLKFIDPQIFESNTKLRVADFRNNRCIDRSVNFEFLQDFVSEIKVKCEKNLTEQIDVRSQKL